MRITRAHIVKRIAVACCVAAAASVSVEAQATSIFNMILVGERVESGDIRSIALGGSAQLVPDSLGVLYSNPALLSRTRLVTLGASQILALDESRSSDYTERDNSFIFPTLRIAFPIMGRFVLSVGYVSRYDPDGSFILEGQTNSGDNYTRRFTKSGGLFAIPFVASADITKYASVGVQFAFEEGNVEERWDTEFEDPLFAPVGTFQTADLSGTSYGGGLILRPIEALMIGGSFESKIEYDADVSRVTGTAPAFFYEGSPLDSTFSGTGSLPARATVAATLELGRWLFLGSYAWSDFAEFEGLAFPQDRLSMEKSVAVGVEYDGIPIRRKRFPVRLSFNYQQLPFDHPKGNAINKWLVGLGTGINVRGGRAKFDFAIQAGKAGSLGENGLEDRLFRIYVGLVGGERWSRRAAGGTR